MRKLAICLQFYLAAEIKMWSQTPKLPSFSTAWEKLENTTNKNEYFFKINKIRKPWKSQPSAMRDVNKYSELVSMTLRLYLSEGTKCQSGFSLLEAGTQVSMETRRRWRCLWRGFLCRFPFWQFTFAEDINTTAVLEKIKNILTSLDRRPWHCCPLSLLVSPLGSVKKLYPLTVFTYLWPYYKWLNYWCRWKINLTNFPP